MISEKKVIKMQLMKNSTTTIANYRTIAAEVAVTVVTMSVVNGTRRSSVTTESIANSLWSWYPPETAEVAAEENRRRRRRRVAEENERVRGNWVWPYYLGISERLHRRLWRRLRRCRMFRAKLWRLCVDREFQQPIFPMVFVSLLCIFFVSRRMLLLLLYWNDLPSLGLNQYIYKLLVYN